MVTLECAQMEDHSVISSRDNLPAIAFPSKDGNSIDIAPDLTAEGSGGISSCATYATPTPATSKLKANVVAPSEEVKTIPPSKTSDIRPPMDLTVQPAKEPANTMGDS